ncbi:MAG: hypothetical protein ABIH69_05155, partial [bacterium]
YSQTISLFIALLYMRIMPKAKAEVKYILGVWVFTVRWLNYCTFNFSVGKKLEVFSGIRDLVYKFL